MFLASLLLFWVPVAGPLLAGFLGGRASGGAGDAVGAVFLTGTMLGLLLFVLADSLTSLPVIGAVAGAGGIILSLSYVGPLLIGALIGGLLAET